MELYSVIYVNFHKGTNDTPHEINGVKYDT